MQLVAALPWQNNNNVGQSRAATGMHWDIFFTIWYVLSCVRYTSFSECRPACAEADNCFAFCLAASFEISCNCRVWESGTGTKSRIPFLLTNFCSCSGSGTMPVSRRKLHKFATILEGKTKRKESRTMPGKWRKTCVHAYTNMFRN